MREILFKAKRLYNGEWVEGYLFFIADIPHIICDGKEICMNRKNADLYATELYEVDKNTICQYTGLTDKNGNKIWENDVVEEDWGNYKGVVRFGEFENVIFKNIGFNIEWLKNLDYRQDILYWADKSVVIGNAFDNEDLLQ